LKASGRGAAVVDLSVGDPISHSSNVGERLLPPAKIGSD
jgi:hypothetical protein